MPVLDEDQLQQRLSVAVERLRAALSPVAIYFFGSYVYGTPKSGSDLDLVVVLDSSSLHPYERDASASRALGDLPVPVDVQVYTHQEFEQRAKLPNSFERTVKSKGRLVYAA